MKPIFNRLLSGSLSMVTTISAIPIVSAHAEESAEPSPYPPFSYIGSFNKAYEDT